MSPPKKTLLQLLLLLPALATAHFTLNQPPAIGPFDEDSEGTAPCGGKTPDPAADNATDFHVGGEPVALFLGHPQAQWLFRGTLDTSAAPGNWSQLFPVVQQVGLGDFCEPVVAAPAEWAGSTGVLGVVADAPDGLLYQCAVVHFVSGTGTATSSCKNSSVTASFVNDNALSGLVGSGSNSSSGSSSSSTASSSASGSSSTSSSSSGATVRPAAAAGLLGGLGAAFVLGAVGAGLVL